MRPETARPAAAFLRSEYDAQEGAHLGCLDGRDIDAAIEAAKLKKVPATQLRRAWEAACHADTSARRGGGKNK
jgi:hypothetical protein